MLRAFKLAKDYDGLTGSNPSVGALLVKDGKILGEGFHMGPGMDHAEVVAIKNAVRDYGRSSVKGATIYVTLEPCSSWGRTPPCTDILSQFGIEKVVVGAWDPNPLNHKKSLFLAKNGIKVTKIKGKLSVEIEKFYEPFKIYVCEKRPYVIVKIAQSLDGKVVDREGNSKWITGKLIRDKVHRELRYRVDAIVTGIGTVLKDDPNFTVRAKPEFPKRLLPIFRVVLDTDLKTMPEAKIVKTATRDYPLIFFVSNVVSELKLQNFMKAIGEKRDFVMVEFLEKENGFNLVEILHLLASKGISRILVEAGPRLVSSLIKLGLVDKIILCVSTSFLGGGKNCMEVEELNLKNRVWLNVFKIEQIGINDLWLEAYVYRNN